jgi:hypothetical protein
MKVLSFREYKMLEDFFNFFENQTINESDESKDSMITTILKGLSKDLKFNYALVFTFGAGIKAMLPIVQNLIENENIKVELTTENLVLITLASLAITYLEESGNKSGDGQVPCDCVKKLPDCEICGGSGMIQSVVTKGDARTILEELKLRGIGNGIVQKIVGCFKSIGKFLKVLFKNSSYIINGLMDMLGYAAILVPTMNAISAIVGEYSLDFKTLPGNLLSLGFGVTTFVAKNAFISILNKLKGKLKIDTKHLEVPTAAKPYEISDGDEDLKNLKGNNLIKEQ